MQNILSTSVPRLERVVIEVFGGCNYSCEMCPQSTGRGADFTKKMPLELFENILDQITPRYGRPVINLEGSGEPTLAKDLPLYVEACTRRGLPSYMYCNGSNLSGQFMRDVIDAGMSFIRFSCIGYDRSTYHRWMSEDNFERIKSNALETKAYIQTSESDCKLASYHLIIDHDRMDFEIEQYQKNFIQPIGCLGYIWKMHNWSGNYTPVYVRHPKQRKTCGRPFAPELTIRAGGLDGHYGAVTPCCQTMGPPNEALSVLAHMDCDTLEQAWFSEAYQRLRDSHAREDFDSVPYCKNCDFLYEDPEVLVWSNDPKASIDHMLGTDFSLKKFKK